MEYLLIAFLLIAIIAIAKGGYRQMTAYHARQEEYKRLMREKNARESLDHMTP